MKNNGKNYPFPLRGEKEGSQPEISSFELLRNWRNSLEQNKGDRAALRRAATLTEVMFIPSFHLLLNRLHTEGYIISDIFLPKLAAIAGLSARIEDFPDASGKLGKRFGMSKSGEKPLLSSLRMRRILACDNFEELYILLRRALSIADNVASLKDLAAIIWNWMPLDSKNPYDSRRRLALDYYAAAPI